ncbi:amino acid adenylation domain-containing protein [Bacillus cytotoxicus]|uniref:Amino acid adenylation domain-containing protein n=1 Tax=Bacillus cytotoxicus TaxID=580165 RepID=A0ACC6AEG4_9BACI|nr:amino acid adenylation domain-containing protein [Bacillus cytotoxicus]
MKEIREYDPMKYWKEAIKVAKKSEEITWSNYDAELNEEGQYAISIDKCYSDRLKEICKNNDLVAYTFLVSVFKVSLSKYLLKKDITIGIPCYRSASQRRIMLNKVLPLSSNIDYDQSFSNYMLNIKNEILQIYKNQSDLNAKILQDEKINNLMELTPINICMKGLHQEKDIDYIINSSKNQLSFLLESLQNGFSSIRIIYNKKQFSESDVKVLCKSFDNVFKSVLVNYNQKISELKLLSEEEKYQILYKFNDTDAYYPKDVTIQRLFEEQVEKTPDKVAVVFEENKLTYRELNEKANSLAGTLREKGAVPETVVALMVDRSVEMIVGVLGIIKSGAAYMPIDPTYPKERVSYILENSNVDLLITESKFIDSIELDCEILDINEEHLYLNDKSNLDIVNKQEDLLYVLYTSGTTGKPKGVMVTQGNLINMVYSWIGHYKLDQLNVNLLQMASISFDVFSGDLCRSLLTGGTMYICPSNVRTNMEELYQVIKKNQINIFESTPSLILIFMDYVNENKLELDSLKLLILGSDSCSIEDYKGLVKKYGNTMRVVNSYGVTEATIDSSYYEDKTQNIHKSLVNTPIGKPMHNTKFYILSETYDIQPVGVIGELYISGAGVARGYYNRPELTTEKFVDNPFVIGTKMYKTGDLARWLPDGNVEFLGRMDNQVKIRGFRIELGEIENRLLQHESIKEAVVLAKETRENEKYICAYVVGNKDVKELNLRGYLREYLPKYMVPSYFVQMDKMPLTPNGKLNRKALPEPDLEGFTNEYEAPRNEVEEVLARVWSEVLKLEKIGINDNFFELGGHSLKATILVGRIRKELEVEVPLKEIFSLGDIKGLSEYILSINKKQYEEIEEVEEKEYYEASSVQKRMYMLQEFDRDSIAYNMPGILEVVGNLDINRLNESFTKLIERHGTLRTSFYAKEDKIVQKVHAAEEIKFEAEKVDVKSEEEIKEKAKEFIKPFDLEKAPLLRVSVLSLEEDRHIMLFDMHHIISDGTSISILAKEFSELYAGKYLEELKVQYKDYSAWQLKKRESEEYRKQEEYWLKEFSGEIPVLNMFTDYIRPKVKDFRGESISFVLDKKITEKLRSIAKETGSTLYMILLANINILLSRYSGQEDIVVGSAIAGRNHRDLENIIGMFVNTLAMRSTVNSKSSFKDYLMSVNEKALMAYENQDYQIEELVEKVAVNRELNRNPLFDVMFVLQNTEEDKLEAEELIFKPYDTSYDVEKFDITINAMEENDEINFHISYATSLYKHETIERMVNHFLNIVKETAKNTKIKLKDIEILGESEKNKLIVEFNDTVTDYPREKVIHELFEEQVNKVPDNIAVVFESKKLTYRELNDRSNSLARVLREKGVGPDVIVGIITERSIEVIVGIMAILKAGGAYLPIDLEYPQSRIEYMIESSNTRILLAQNDLKGCNDFGCEVLDLSNGSLFSKDNRNLEIMHTSNNVAYVIYTSGTTGIPKGVEVIQRNVVRLVKNTNYIEIKDNDRILQTGSIAFDASTFEIWGALLNGAALHLVSKEIILNANKLKQYLTKNEITILWLTSPLFNKLVEDNSTLFKGVKYLLVGGDVVSLKHVMIVRKQAPIIKVINGYGPTENTTFSTCYEINDTTNVLPIGKPIANSTAYILDKNNKLVPIGVPGELYVGGDGVAKGYLNNEELTKGKFVKNPYKHGEKMYRTGDLTRWLPDGNIEFLGRIDNQVKIRGFRIELDGIENRLLEIEGIEEVVVLDKGEAENKYLCAYYVTEKEYSVGELRENLKKYLPDYMIPSYFIKLKEIPLTSNGKVDRRSLPEPEGEINTGSEYEAPRNELENQLVIIWKNVLRLSNIGINDDFFDLGGHSLIATKLVGRIHKELNVQVPLKEIFNLRNIKKLSEYIIEASKGAYKSIALAEEKDYYEVSSAQKRMYILQEFDKNSIAYNIPLALEIVGDFQLERIDEIFLELMKRHETLRTTFHTKNQEILQQIHSIEEIQFHIDKIDISDESEETREGKLQEQIKKFVKLFDLEKLPLFRVSIIQVEKNKYIMLLDIHHIISDGTSMSILMKEFGDLYANKKLEELRIQYKDYSTWQRNSRRTLEFKNQEEYWLKEFSDNIPTLNLPTDYARPEIKNFNGDSVKFILDKEITYNLIDIAKETGSTLYMILLANINILLSKYSGQEDIIVGTPIAGRNHRDLENLVGMFVNTLAIRTIVENELSFKEYLKKVKEKTLRAYENQDYQFEELIDKVGARRSLNRNPIFDIMFVLQNFEESSIKLDNLTFRTYDFNNYENMERFDITIEAFQSDDKIHFKVSYLTDLYEKHTVERIVQLLQDLIKLTSTTYLDKKIGDIELLTNEEKSIYREEINYYNSNEFDFSL